MQIQKIGLGQFNTQGNASNSKTTLADLIPRVMQLGNASWIYLGFVEQSNCHECMEADSRWIHQPSMPIVWCNG
jgi:hypothetical protein